jgi:hypothetical protein
MSTAFRTLLQNSVYIRPVNLYEPVHWLGRCILNFFIVHQNCCGRLSFKGHSK